MTYDAVVFDMDGVIFDSERATFLCWQELAERHGLADIRTPYYACIGVTAARTKEIMLGAYGQDMPFDEYEKEALALYHERYDFGKLPVKPGVRELLCFLRASGRRIALASSTKRQTVEDELRWAGIREYFDAVICGDMVTRSKPAPDIFLKACETLGTDPGRSYAIEDSYNGIRAAAAGGLRPVMVPDMLPATDEMCTLSETVLPDLLAVRDYLAAKSV